MIRATTSVASRRARGCAGALAMVVGFSSPMPLLAAAPTAAEPAASPEDEANTLRSRGEEHFSKGEFREAIDAFERAHDLSPDPTDLFNLGRIYEEAGDLPSALERYERFAQQPRLELEERRVAAERIEVLRMLVQKSKDEDPPKAGNADVTGPANGNGSGQSDQDLSRVGRPLIVSGATLTAIGTALAVGGGLGFGMAARRNSDQIDQLNGGSNPQRLTLTDAEELNSRGKDFETLQITSMAVGAAVSLVGIGLLAAGVHRRRHARFQAVAPAVTPNFVAVTSRWRF